MVSLNPEYGIEVSALKKLAERVKDTNPELCAICTILIASILANDEKKLLEYCSKYIETKAYEDSLKHQINKMIEQQFGFSDDELPF
jgi:hypothetical protein